MRHAVLPIALLLLVSMAAAQNQAINTANPTSGYVLVPTNPTLVPAQITIEAWVYFLPMNLTPAGVYPTVIRKNVLNGQEVYFLRVQQGTGRVAWKVRLPGGLSATAISPAALPTNVWTHLAGTWDGSTCRLYLNGVQVATAAGSGALTDNGGDVRIGEGDSATGGGETWNGAIDEVRLWSVARAASQILGTMNWQLDGQPGLVSAWHFDGNYNDSTGSNHGTPTGSISLAPSGFTLNTGTPPYQVNSPLASLDFDGIQGNGYAPAIVTHTFTSCAPATSTVHFTSTITGLPYDVAITAGPSVPATAGGLWSLNGQAVNVNLNDPTLIFLNGFAFTTPFASFSLPLTIPAAFAVTGQMIIVAPGTPDGFALSAVNELQVVAGATSIPGPTGDDSGVTVQLSNPAFCNPPATIPFYGTSYTQFDVISNGRVIFGEPAINTAFSATVAGAQTGSYPFVGAWCDLNPSAGGTITIATTAPGVVRVSYTGVYYFGTTTPNTFAFQFDGLTGIVTMDGLPGIAVGTGTQFLGISPGTLGPATDPGATNFIVGGPFVTANLTDMIYRYGTEGTLTPGIARIDFVPNATGYGWIGY